ncbi:YdeI/OmpD-associated family protein [Actinomycetaceae bacterium MB13-C1-2]|nr:YdeI/OmpD-associated family protein [Actinomycetaceae bacterium MB13-C1-2]
MAISPVEVDFDAPVERLAGRAIVRLPAIVSAELPSRGQVAAEITVTSTGSSDGPISTVIEPDGLRGHWLPLDRFPCAENVREGALVSVRLLTKRDWPEPEIPDDLTAALSGAPDLADTWDDITPMARWEWVRWIGATKNPETRAKRIRVTIDKLRNGKRRPCCFDLSSCTDPDLAKSGKLMPATSTLD